MCCAIETCFQLPLTPLDEDSSSLPPVKLLTRVSPLTTLSLPYLSREGQRATAVWGSAQTHLSTAQSRCNQKSLQRSTNLAQP